MSQTKEKNVELIDNIQFQQVKLNDKLNMIRKKIEKTEKLKAKMHFLEGRIKKTRATIAKMREKPYIVISNLSQLFNINNSDHLTHETDWKSRVYQLFYESNLPQIWILETVNYNDKDIFVYLISETVKKIVKSNIRHFLSEQNEPNVIIF